MVILAALGAALAYAVASVLQQQTATDTPAEEALRVSLVVRLARRPRWLVGIAADLAGYGLQFFALGHGSLVLVQPLLVCGLLFALPLGAALTSRRWLTGREWAGSAVVVAGLAVFLVTANPAPGASTTSVKAWVIVTAATLAPAVLLVGASRRAGPALRATLLATGAGFIYGLTAAFTKTVSYALTGARGGPGHAVIEVLSRWQTYGLVLAGGASLVLAMTAFQAGPLGWSLPALSGIDPVVSVVIGALAFHETVSASPAGLAAESAGLVLVLVGIAVLNRSDLLGQRQGRLSGEPEETAAPGPY